MDEFWVCDHCKSLNRIKTAKCYSCKTPKGGVPEASPRAQAGAGPTATAASAGMGQSPSRPVSFADQRQFAPQTPPMPQNPAMPPMPPLRAVPPMPSAPQTAFGQATTPFSGYPSTAPAAQPSMAQVPPAAQWAPSTQAAQVRSNNRALAIIGGLALAVVIGTGALIAIVPALSKPSSTALVAAASASATPTETATPTEEITPSPTPKPTPTPTPSLAVSAPPKGYQQLASATYGYAFSFPAAWIYVSEDDPRSVAEQTATLKAANPSLAALIDSETAFLNSNYRVAIFDPASSASSRKGVAGLFAVLPAVPPASVTPAAVKSAISGLGTVTGVTTTSVKEPAGPGVKAVGSEASGGVPVKVVMYLIAGTNHCFVFAFATTSSTYSAYSKTFDQIVATLQDLPEFS